MTHFFRDANASASLNRRIIPRVVQHKRPQDHVRHLDLTSCRNLLIYLGEKGSAHDPRPAR